LLPVNGLLVLTHMHSALNRILLCLAAAIVLVDTAWLLLGNFAVDWHPYGFVSLLMAPLLAGAVYYDRLRSEPAMSAMLGCAAFLIVFAAAASLASYLLATISGPRIDGLLAEADRIIGFHWPSLMAFAAEYPLFNGMLALVYLSVMPQMLLLLLWLGARDQLEDLYGLAFSMAYGAIITLTIWTAFPSFGAFSVFILPHDVASKLNLIAGFDYAHDLVEMLESGPGLISPRDLRGLVGFPSYHTLQAVVLTWYARGTLLRWPLIALNSAVLIAIPLHGGHHIVDIIGGLFVGVIAILMARMTLAAVDRSASTAAIVSRRLLLGDILASKFREPSAEIR
jgi:hypothetical protein